MRDISLVIALVLGAVLLAAGSAAAAPRPIVAVFDIDAGTLPLDAAARRSMTDFLAARLTASGAFRTVPRSQVRQRLTQLKVESYEDCYDQACQIELGRELAAQISLSAKVHEVEETCVLTLELYDLASATTQAAATARGGCTEAALFKTIVTAVDELVVRYGASVSRGAGGSASRPAVPAAERPKVSVSFTSEPSHADVLIDGLHRGKTPVRLALDRDTPVEMTLLHEGYHEERQTLVAHDARAVHVPLQITPEGRMERAATSEWLGFGLGPGYRAGSGVAGISADIRLANIKGHSFFWTLVDLHIHAESHREASGSTTSEGSDTVMIVAGSRAGYPMYFGVRGQHQLLFGLGAGYLAGGVGGQPAGVDSAVSAFVLSPGVDYVYNLLDGMFPIGLGLRANFPVAGDMGPESYPFTMSASVNFGFSLYRMMAGASRVARGQAEAAAGDEGSTGP